VEALIQTRQETVYFFGENWIPVWPVSFAVEMTTVLLVTLTMLFLPKLLALLLLLKDSRLRTVTVGCSRRP
jgi:membrane glycosyltransferase